MVELEKLNTWVPRHPRLDWSPSRKGCPICKHKDEDWAHILQCPHPTRAQWRRQVVSELKQTCHKWKTNPDLRDILIDGIIGWWSSADIIDYELPTAVYDDKYTRLINQQNRTGWNQIFLGRFSWEWSDTQDDFYATRQDINPKKRLTGLRWQSAIINTLWDQWYALWEMRNRDVHGANKTQQARVERTNALRTLRELYSLRPHVEPSVTSLLMRDIRDHAANPTWQIRNWIATNESIIRASYRHVKKKAIKGMRSIREYFQQRG